MQTLHECSPASSSPLGAVPPHPLQMGEEPLGHAGLRGEAGHPVSLGQLERLLCWLFICSNMTGTLGGCFWVRNKVQTIFYLPGRLLVCPTGKRCQRLKHPSHHGGFEGTPFPEASQAFLTAFVSSREEGGRLTGTGDSLALTPKSWWQNLGRLSDQSPYGGNTDPQVRKPRPCA